MQTLPVDIKPDVQNPRRGRMLPVIDRMSTFPWWALAIAILGVLIAWRMLTDDTYLTIIDRLKDGLIVTIRVTFIAYAFALLFGLTLALARISTNVFLRNVAAFYVEIIRGLPILVILLYVAFVLTPLVTTGLSSLGTSLESATSIPLIHDLGSLLSGVKTRDVSNEFRVILSLALAYAAFLSEIFRAGIESVGLGQMEAARALGMSYWQAMRVVILRQAIRNVLPPLGNDFISMLKDSSLASVLGVEEITRLAETYSASSFLYVQTYNVLAYMYLALTLSLSLLVKLLERQMSRDRRRSA